MCERECVCVCVCFGMSGWWWWCYGGGSTAAQWYEVRSRGELTHTADCGNRVDAAAISPTETQTHCRSGSQTHTHRLTHTQRREKARRRDIRSRREEEEEERDSRRIQQKRSPPPAWLCMNPRFCPPTQRSRTSSRRTRTSGRSIKVRELQLRTGAGTLLEYGRRP